MKIWVDSTRPAPKGYREVKSVKEAMEVIRNYETMYRASGEKDFYKIELIDLEYWAGTYYADGGNYIEILNWLEATNRNYPIHIHTTDPIGRKKIKRIIQKNGWREI